MLNSFDVVIVGGGLAGASTFWHLSRRNAGRVLLIEKEPRPGLHSSSRNAAIARQAVADPFLAEMARESVTRLRQPPEDWPGRAPLVGREGLLLVQEETDEGPLGEVLGACGGLPIELVELSPEQAVKRQPLLRKAPVGRALFSPGDGVVDVHALLTGFLQGGEERGGRVRAGTTAAALVRSGDRVTGVLTQEDRIDAGTVVIASGAWAGELASAAGIVPPPLRVTRRHLFVSEPVRASDPMVWRLGEELYFRREGPGLLLSPCDVEDHPPGLPSRTLEAEETLLAALPKAFPRLSGLRMRRGWAGLRVLTPDGRHVLGPDPSVDGLVWCVGLGGHGVTTAWETGRLTAEAVLSGTAPPSVRPDRF